MVLLKNKFSLFSAALLLTVASVRATPDASLSVQSLLASADALLAAGDKHAALEHFDVAIKKDPTNYLTFFKRGATYLALGRSSKASEDFEAVLILKPGFEAALLQRAKLKAKLGDWDAARIDYIEAGAEKHVMYIQEIEEAAAAAKAAQAAEERQEWDTCVERAGSAILVANGVVYLRSLRARCRMEKGDVHEAVGDLTHIAQLDPSSIDPHIKIANLLYYSARDYDRSTAQLRKCLHSDPDSKQCSKLLRRIKNYEKLIAKAKELRSKRQFNSANKIILGVGEEKGVMAEIEADISNLIKDGYINKQCPETLMAELQEMVCDSFIEMNRPEKARPYCVEALRHNPKSVPGLLSNANRLISEELYEEAVNILEKAKDDNEAVASDRRILAKLKEARQLLQRSKNKDYYGVLGLKHGATPSEIKKAYRALIKKFHPDKYRGDLSQEDIQKKMSAINEANEVLTNPEMKEMVDRGIDPLAQETQQNPFQGGQNPFGGFGGPQFVFRQGGGAGGNPFGNGFKFQF